MTAWCVEVDPLFCSGQRWVQAMLLIEFTIYPWYCIAVCATIHRGLETASEGMKVATVVFATANSYSVILLAAETFIGSASNRPIAPWLWMTAYVPFLLIPACFACRMWSSCANAMSVTKTA
jgi:hypothetical protein